ncbi:MAG TPA: S8/S53 family peptidase [Actinoplanes sp.]|nr:S8/S53 family peptidase [Actinoplanes sp.]
MGRQVRVLTSPDPGDVAFDADRSSVVQLMINRQQRAAAAGTRFVVLMQNDRPVLVAEQELVVEAGDAPFTAAHAADRPGRRVQIHQVPDAQGPEGLLAEAQTLRTQDFNANVNPAVPLGYVIKGDAFPGLTSVTLGRFPAGPIDPSVRVAIIDTGRFGGERGDGWFTGVEAKGVDLLDEVPPKHRNDFFAGHGTFTAGIVRQISAACEIAVYRFTGNDGLGTDTAAAAAMLQAAADGAGKRLIINASFGVPAVHEVPPLAIKNAVESIARDYPDVLIVASAGNDNRAEKLYPAGFDQVRAVAALNPDLSRAPFSNYGDWVDCSAVGVGVVSTFVPGTVPPEPDLGDTIVFPEDSWATWSGTSFSAPQICGGVAHLCTLEDGLSPKDAFDRLVAGRDVLPDLGAVVHILPGTDLPRTDPA